MSDTPWRNVRPSTRAIFNVPGQITREERLLYYWMAKELYTGVGEIVEVGALVGASSICLAEGLIRNPAVEDKRKRLHSFDRFIAGPELCRDFLDRQYPADRITAGADFSHIYRRNVADVAKCLQITKVDAHELRWSGRPIEILFIDCAASPLIYDHLMRELFPYLIPDRSWVIDQDFFFQDAPWLPINAENLGMQPVYFEDCTLVSKIGSNVAENIGNAICAYSRSTVTQNIATLRRHAAKYPPYARQLMRLQEAVILLGNGRVDEAARYAEEVRMAPLHSSAEYRANMVLEMLRARRSAR